MASTFYIVHHEFRAGTSSKLWEPAYAAKAPGCRWEEIVASNKEKGFSRHSANTFATDGPIYSIWKQKKVSQPKSFNYSLMVPQFLDFV